MLLSASDWVRVVVVVMMVVVVVMVLMLVLVLVVSVIMMIQELLVAVRLTGVLALLTSGRGSWQPVQGGRRGQQ